MARAPLLLVAVLALAVSGCGHSHRGGGGGGTAETSATVVASAGGGAGTTTFVTVVPLTVDVTNSSCATIDVTADTPDETVDFGFVGPGETISVDLNEMPPYAILHATVVDAGPCGYEPVFVEDTIDLGADYSSTDTTVTVDWSDSSSSDPTDYTATNESVAPGTTAASASGSHTFFPHAAATPSSVRVVTPVITKKGPVSLPTPTR